MVTSSKEVTSIKEIEKPSYTEDNFFYNKRCYLKLQTGPTKYFVLDSQKNICEIVQINEDKKTGKKYEIRHELLAHYYISSLVIFPYISELNNPTMYSFDVNTKDDSYRIGPSTLEEIQGELKSRGLFYKNRMVMDVITNSINALKNNGMYNMETISPYPGFFILNGEFKSTKKYIMPEKEPLAEALILLNEFAEHYDSFAPKLGYIFRWILMSPFSFIIKQKGSGTKINNLLLYGSTRTGKSTIAKLSCFIWDLDFPSQQYSGSMVHSVYQYGVAISKSTYPIILDEGENLYNEPDLASMLKTATHSLKARARYNNNLQRQEEINALAPVIITSNYNKPNDGALGARIDLIEYPASDLREKEDRDIFNRKFDPEKEDGPLKIIRFIGDFVGASIIEDPCLLDGDWLIVASKLICNMYDYAELEIPKWIKDYENPDGVEKSFEDEYSYIISNIKALIIEKVEINGWDEELKEFLPVDAKLKAKKVVEDSLKPWIYCHEPERGLYAREKFVWIEKSIETDLKKEKNLNITLDRIAELFGGEMKRVSKGNTKIRVAVFDFDEFIDQF